MIVAILGCSAKKFVPLPAGDPLFGPSLPPMAPVGESSRPAPVFGPRKTYAGSPPEEVKHQALFDVHRPEANQVAVLKNGEDSFAVRVQLLEAAQTSIRIQALIFWADESGLHIAEILKKKKAAGLDVRVIVDAAANLGWQTQWMYFDLKQHGIEVQGYESLYLEWINEVPIPFLSPATDPEAPNHRYHEKMWIVDGEADRGTAVVGGLNIANEYFRVDPSDPDRF
jgi:phosphatidylserine/phosphatidylglycerophosphate/cardiolipin synthase-like enzyme